MESQLPENYQKDLQKAEKCAIAGIGEVVASDPRVQIFSTKPGEPPEPRLVFIKVFGEKSRGLYDAFVEHLEGWEDVQKSWKDGVGVISYTPEVVK